MKTIIDVSACVFSNTGLRLLKILIDKDIKLKCIYVSKCDSQESLRKIQEIALSKLINVVVLDKHRTIDLFEAKSNASNGSYLLLLWWPFILKKNSINLFNHVLNVHPSLLPFGKGKYGYFWSIINSEPFGVTIHLVDEGIDSGKILAQKVISVESTDTAGDLYEKGVKNCIILFNEVIENLLYGNELADSCLISKQENNGSYYNIKDFKNYCLNAEESNFKLKQAINYLRARTFENGSSYTYKVNDKLYECKISIREVS